MSMTKPNDGKILGKIVPCHENNSLKIETFSRIIINCSVKELIGVEGDNYSNR